MGAQIFDLSGKVSVVSGAAQGMGRAMSVALAESGSDMAIIDFIESVSGSFEFLSTIK